MPMMEKGMFSGLAKVMGSCPDKSAPSASRGVLDKVRSGMRKPSSATMDKAKSKARLDILTGKK